MGAERPRNVIEFNPSHWHGQANLVALKYLASVMGAMTNLSGYGGSRYFLKFFGRALTAEQAATIRQSPTPVLFA